MLFRIPGLSLWTHNIYTYDIASGSSWWTNSRKQSKSAIIFLKCSFNVSSLVKMISDGTWHGFICKSKLIIGKENQCLIMIISELFMEIESFLKIILFIHFIKLVKALYLCEKLYCTDVSPSFYKYYSHSVWRWCWWTYGFITRSWRCSFSTSHTADQAGRGSDSFTRSNWISWSRIQWPRYFWFRQWNWVSTYQSKCN